MGRERDAVTPRSDSRVATVFEVIDGSPSECTTSGVPCTSNTSSIISVARIPSRLSIGSFKSGTPISPGQRGRVDQQVIEVSGLVTCWPSKLPVVVRILLGTQVSGCPIDIDARDS